MPVRLLVFPAKAECSEQGRALESLHVWRTVFFCGAGDETKDLVVHTGQVLCH